MNFHDLTKEVSKYEGKNKQTNIAQINEVVSITLAILKREIKKSPVKGVYNLVKLIKSVKPLD